MKERPYDLAIIGAGSAGLIAADFACRLGARVALCERERIGGDCTWTGCVPSKSLLKVAKVAHEMRTAARFGIASHPPAVDMGQVRDYLRSTIAQIYNGTTPEALEQKGIDVVLGATSFVDSHTLAVGERRLRAKSVLIATGSEPRLPSLLGLDGVPFLTYREIFENDRLPEAMVVVGGGPLGVEIAQAYGRLGSRVTIFAQRLLPKEEPEAAGIVARVLQREGVCVVDERAESVSRNDDRIRVRSKRNEVECDLLLAAVGRRPSIEGLNLEAAGVTYSERGIGVNDQLRTSAKKVYAAGDVLGGEQFSHLAGWQGFQAARNALLPGKSSGFSSAMPRVTFSDPEVAHVGKTEAQARSANANDVMVAQWPIEREDRAICDDDRDGILKFITRRNGSILGATIVGHRAGEAIMELVVALKHDLRIGQIAGTIHPYPTYASGVQLLTSQMAMDQAFNSLAGQMIRTVSKLSR
jgi:pyruvate/2-oxoglutarate dehydrogenase complex dihydrolipoamide dehydrogenase (E3) component